MVYYSFHQPSFNPVRPHDDLVDNNFAQKKCNYCYDWIKHGKKPILVQNSEFH